MKSTFFKGNRLRLRKQAGSLPIVIAGNTAMQSRGDASFRFEQESNFWWLTGIEAPNWMVIIEGNKTTLVAPEIEAVHQIFDGSLDHDEAKRISGADDVITHEKATKLFKALAKKHTSVMTLGKDPLSSHYDFTMNPAQSTLLRLLKKSFSDVQDGRLLLAKLRAIKQPGEIEAIRRAVALTAEAFVRVHQKLLQYTHEYHIEADFTHAFRSSGAPGHAYEPIVASGINACTLHYNQNQAKLKEGELVLLDVGARVDGYAADITRTYAFGKPTQRQREVHAAVESAHHQIIQLLRPGLAVLEYQEKVDEIMRVALDSLGLLGKPDDYRRYFPHAISHGLGVDVHDALGRPEVFLPGMVLTVEPGIYIPEEKIGVRIEDDILITKTGYENLSAALPTSL